MGYAGGVGGLACTDVDHIGYMKHTKEEDIVQALTWCDDNLPAGSYFQEWTPFDHPQVRACRAAAGFR